MAAAASIAVPYILPSGRLFAASGSRLVNHVVFCMFAGGVRNIESIGQQRGNLMPRSFAGSSGIDPVISAGIDNLPGMSGLPLQSYGTLFRQFRYAQGPTGHFNGHSTALTGNYTLQDLNIKEPPKMPTVFEYYRKHNSPAQTALNAWWISNSLGPYPSLNFSSYPGYGALYGANFMQPLTLISSSGIDALSNPKIYSASQQTAINDMRNVFDQSFSHAAGTQLTSIRNQSLEGALVQDFIRNQLNAALAGQLADPWGVGASMNGDMYNVYFAEKVIEEFKPELLVVNMQGVDICHSNYTEYCNNLHKADYAVGHLWQTIQNTPGMANDTILIVAPEHGRNLEPNTIVDQFGQAALDHNSDNTSREIFCLIAGPPSKVVQNQLITQVTGESIDIVPSIAHILGYKDEVPGGMMPGRVLNEAFI